MKFTVKKSISRYSFHSRYAETYDFWDGDIAYLHRIQYIGRVRYDLKRMLW